MGCTEHLPSLDAQPGSSTGTIELRFDLSFARHLRVAKNSCLFPSVEHIALNTFIQVQVEPNASPVVKIDDLVSLTNIYTVVSSQ